MANRATYQATYLFSVKKCFEPCNEYEVCSRFVNRDPGMLYGHCFKIARQMYRSFSEHGTALALEGVY